MAKQNKPAIRFKGFTDAWEQRKFSDLYAPLVERNSDLLPYNKTLSVATMTYKTDGNGAADSSLANYKRLRTGDIAFEGHTSKSFRYGRFVLNDVGDGIMSPRFSALRPLAQMPTNFWKYYIHYEPIMRKILVASTKAGTMMNELVIDEFLKSSVLVPSIEEQTRIGSILKNIDNLITLHQRKYDKLQVLKKAMLEKMFPKNGSSVPEIRFKGFTDAWEQRKLGDCFTERCESMPDGELISVTINDGIKKFSELGRHDNSNDDKSKYKKVCAGDIAYNSMRMWQGASGCSPYEGIVSPAYTVLTPNSGINSKCMAYQFKLPATIHTFKINSQGITSDNWNLKFPALSEIEIYVSPYEQEQAKIAAYFANLDHLITLHQRELEKLQNIKKSMLEKMFV